MADTAERSYTEELLDYPETIKRCVVVFFYGRSGSYLLCSLLDNHPHVLETVPLGVQDAGVAFERMMRETPGGTTPEILAERVCEAFPELFGTKIGMGRLESDRAVDRERFASLFARSIRSAADRGVSTNGTTVFNALHIAYAAALDQQITTKDPVIVWNFHVPNEPRLRFVRLLYPDAKGIVCIRNPWQTLDSHFHSHLTEYPIRPFSHLPGLLLGQLLQNGQLFAGETEQSFAGVRFEDLHLRTESTMRAVADWIGIPWHSNLLVSSFNGQVWWHKKDGVEFSGARPAQALPQPTKHLTLLDKALIGWLLAKEFAAWGYDNSFYEKNKDLLRPLIEDVLIHLPTGMELAAFRTELVELLKTFWGQRRALAAFIRDEKARREQAGFRVLPILHSDTP